ncbi:hypothetical protein L0P57_06125 [Anaeromassilibacillus senegalensis]|uniref:Uncharacterized protein n=1 Tax=Anaeromassilibacillus senegalensis TaxID=1673717 RepID=A0ABS9MI67_9FIRM|nr:MULTISPECIES: hypothetical protein [Anaeromassilibacillus]MCG4610509.1 hypothetical protein [Anaeromassilibacillus senegalensis]
MGLRGRGERTKTVPVAADGNSTRYQGSAYGSMRNKRREGAIRVVPQE